MKSKFTHTYGNSPPENPNIRHGDLGPVTVKTEVHTRDLGQYPPGDFPPGVQDVVNVRKCLTRQVLKVYKDNGEQLGFVQDISWTASVDDTSVLRLTVKEKHDGKWKTRLLEIEKPEVHITGGKIVRDTLEDIE